MAEYRPVKKLLKNLVVLGLVGSLAVAGVVALQLWRFQQKTIDLEGSETIFLIRSGSNITTIAQELTRQQIIDDPWLFVLLARLQGLDTRVRAGEYRLVHGTSAEALLQQFTEGNSIQYSFTVIEGWTFRQMLEALARDPIIEHRLEGKDDAEIMRLLGYEGEHPEGRFFPDTYRFPRGTSDIDFLRRAYQVMQRHLQREWEKRAPDLPLDSPYEALTLASIIEKETAVGEERPMIAGVFVERLRRNMRLQTDPTIIYGLGDEFDGDIRYRDLRRDTPYNTYLHAGLTPTPIALPGLDSIRAALQPADTDALFFVSKGDGTHQFSETLEQHNAAVRRYQLNQQN